APRLACRGRGSPAPLARAAAGADRRARVAPEPGLREALQPRLRGPPVRQDGAADRLVRSLLLSARRPRRLEPPVRAARLAPVSVRAPSRRGHGAAARAPRGAGAPGGRLVPLGGEGFRRGWRRLSVVPDAGDHALDGLALSGSAHRGAGPRPERPRDR